MGQSPKPITGLIWQIICILVCVLFVPIIIINLTLSIKAITNPQKLPTVFGYAPMAVLSGSMSPEFEINDLIFIKQADINSLQAKDDIICFVDDDGTFTTHRIERIEEVGGVKHFYTKGDANNAEDTDYILSEQIQGKYIGRVAGLGGSILFLQTPYGMLLTAILLILLYIAGELLIEYRAKKKELKALSAENADLKAENQRLNSLFQAQSNK